MDPLSITTSVVALVQLAGSTAIALNKTLRELRTADERVDDLFNEVNTTQGRLEAIQKTLGENGNLDPVHISEEMRTAIKEAIAYCQTKLKKMRDTVDKIAKEEHIENASLSKRFGWKARALWCLKFYGDDIAECRDDLRQSNMSLQTLLSIMQVSLSLENAAAQDKMSEELHILRASITEARHATSKSAERNRQAHAPRPESPGMRILRNLANEADKFHAAASSTASTVCGDDSIAPSIRHSYPIGQRCPTTDYYNERTRKFVAQQQVGSGWEYEGRDRSSSQGSSSRLSAFPSFQYFQEGSVSDTAHNNAGDDYDGEHDAQVESDRVCLTGLKGVAEECIRSMNYEKAAENLQYALDLQTGSNQHQSGSRSIEIQLAFCYLAQNKWRAAEPLVKKLSKSRDDLDLVVCYFLHALALGLLSDYSYDQALTTCNLELLGRRRLSQTGNGSSEDYHEALALLADIENTRGNPCRAEAYQHQLPAGYQYQNHTSAATFIASKVDVLLLEILGRGEASPSLIRDVDDAVDSHVGEQAQENLESLGGAAARSDEQADDDASPLSIPKKPSLRRLFGQFLSPMRRRPSRFENRPADLGNISSPTGLSRFIGKSLNRLKKSRSLFQKKSPRETLLAPELSRGYSWSGESRCDFSRGLRGTTPVATRFDGTVSGSPDYQTAWVEAMEGNGLEAVVQSAPYFYELSDNSDYPRVDPRRKELEDTGLDTYQIFQRQQQYEKSHIQWPQAPQESQSETTSGCNLAPSGVVQEEPTPKMGEMEAAVLPEVPERTVGHGMIDNGPSTSGSHNLQASTTRGPECQGCRQEPCLCSSASAACNEIVSDLPHSLTENQGSKCSAELREVMAQWSSIVASLSGLTGVESLREKELVLYALLTKLKAISNDRTVLYDTLGVLKSLNLRILAEESRDSDSGYESAASSDGLTVAEAVAGIPTESSQPAEQILEIVTPKRFPSWTKGSGDICSATPTDPTSYGARTSSIAEHRPSPNANVEIEDAVEPEVTNLVCQSGGEAHKGVKTYASRRSHDDHGGHHPRPHPARFTFSREVFLREKAGYSGKNHHSSAGEVYRRGHVSVATCYENSNTVAQA